MCVSVCAYVCVCICVCVHVCVCVCVCVCVTDTSLAYIFLSAKQMVLRSLLDLSKSECLNESDDHPFTAALEPGDGYLESDCDEQVGWLPWSRLFGDKNTHSCNKCMAVILSTDFK